MAMITLDISPNMLTSTAPWPLTMSASTEVAINEPLKASINPTSSASSREKTVIQTHPEGTILGWARQSASPRHMVRFFSGKGGFSVVVSTENLCYIGLPGCHLILPDTEVVLYGAPASKKSNFPGISSTQTPIQQVTRQAMILGAGLATRFEPVSGETTGYPKPGVPLIGSVSVISAIAQLLQQHGIQRILVNTYYRPAVIKAQLDVIPGVEMIYIDEVAPSGTAGGLAKALETAQVDRQQPILIVQGDAVTDADLSLLLNTHVVRHSAVTIGGQIVADEDVPKFGMIETDCSGADKQSGCVTAFKEKPSLLEAGHCRFANTGFYILAPEVYPLFLTGWADHRHGGLYDYAQHVFPLLLDAVTRQTICHRETGQPMGFWAQATDGYWSDIGNPEQYLDAVRDVVAGRVKIALPDPLSDFYEDGVIYWPGARAMARTEQASLSGNVIVVCPKAE
jgi:NDP-sugar pyrophosphorylase family protein